MTAATPIRIRPSWDFTVPELGACSSTVPSGSGVSPSAFSPVAGSIGPVSTQYWPMFVKPLLSSDEIAESALLPMTSGTEDCDPSLMYSVTAAPSDARDPPPGTCFATWPLGRSEATVWTVDEV